MTAVRNDNAMQGERTSEVRERAVSHIVEDDVVAPPTFRKVLFSVINDMVCTDRSDHVHVFCAADPCNFCSERLGDLNSEGSHTARGTIDQDLLTWPNLPRIAETLEGGKCCGKNGENMLGITCG